MDGDLHSLDRLVQVGQAEGLPSSFPDKPDAVFGKWIEMLTGYEKLKAAMVNIFCGS